MLPDPRDVPGSGMLPVPISMLDEIGGVLGFLIII